MKDYTLGSSNNDEFILDYEVDNDKLIVLYASGNVKEFVYTNGKLKEVLLKMKEQVLEVKNLQGKISKKNNFNMMYISIFLILLSFIINPLSHLIISFSLLSMFGIKYMNRLSILRDYNKNRLFIENMKLFQNEIKEDNLKKVNNKYKEDLEYLLAIKQEQNDLKIETLMFFDEKYSILKEPTIKTIDDLSYESLEEIYNVLSDNKREDKKNKKRVLTRNI